jgi:hypothetical protein
MDPSHADTPFSQLLLHWAAYHVARIAASMKPKYIASQVGADVAASGNPTGV